MLLLDVSLGTIWTLLGCHWEKIKMTRIDDLVGASIFKAYQFIFSVVLLLLLSLEIHRIAV